MHEKLDAYKVLYPAFHFVLNRQFDRTVTGIENIPDTPAIYTPNHIRIADSPLVAATYTEATDEPMRFVVKKEYLDGEGIDGHGKLGRSVRLLMEYTGMIPVDREATGVHANQDFQNQVIDRLERGGAVALHPEGTRSDDGRLYKFRSGAAHIALAAHVPIVPVGIIYSQFDNKRKTHVSIEFGQPVMPEEYNEPPYSELAGARNKSEALIQEIENRVALLTGMEQAGKFAELHKYRERDEGQDEA